MHSLLLLLLPTSATTFNTAKGYADALNLNTGTHGAEANAFNTLTSAAMGTFNMTVLLSLSMVRQWLLHLHMQS